MEFFISFILAVTGFMISLVILFIIGTFLWCLAGTIILRICAFFDNLKK